MERRRGSLYAYLMVIFSLVVLGWSVWAMYLAISFYRQGNQEGFFFYSLASVISVVLAVSSLMQTRRRIAILYSPAPRVLTTVLCANCGFKIMRAFSSGDYVHKDVGKCQQCGGTMRIDLIYSEEIRRSSF